MKLNSNIYPKTTNLCLFFSSLFLSTLFFSALSFSAFPTAISLSRNRKLSIPTTISLSRNRKLSIPTTISLSLLIPLTNISYNAPITEIIPILTHEPFQHISSYYSALGLHRNKLYTQKTKSHFNA